MVIFVWKVKGRCGLYLVGLLLGNSPYWCVCVCVCCVCVCVCVCVCGLNG